MKYVVRAHRIGFLKQFTINNETYLSLFLQNIFYNDGAWINTIAFQDEPTRRLFYMLQLIYIQKMVLQVGLGNISINCQYRITGACNN